MGMIAKTRAERIFDKLNYFILVVLSILFLYPFWHVLVLSLSTPLGASRLGLKFWPDQINITTYREILRRDIIYIGYLNTIIRTISGTIITIAITYCASYSLSKKNLPHRTLITFFILFTMFFSGGLIPSYLLIRSLGLIGTRWALILPGATSAWYLLIARNFISSIPVDFEEAALVEGAHPLTVIFYIMLPLSMPIIAVLALWSAVGHWNAWFDAMIYTRQRSHMVLQLIMRSILIESFDQMSDLLGGALLEKSMAETTPASIRAGTVIVTIGPIVLAYPFLQKYFVKGVLVGSLKG